MKIRTLCILAAGAVLTVGCAPKSGSAVAQSGQAARRNPDVISEEELSDVLASGVSNAYDAVRRLRPGFLTYRGQMSITNSKAGTIVVYLNNQRMGDATALRDMQVINIKEIRHLNAAAAQQRFGLDNQAGAIVVTMK